MEPITLAEAAAAVRGDLLGGGGAGTVTDVCTDSRAAAAGSLFVALKGERVDGHRFVAEVLRKGAAGAIIARPQAEALLAETAGLPGRLLAVDDPLLALGDLARWYRSRFDVPVIGITGSVGKTSTKEVAAAILAQRGPTLCTQANYNTEIGLPLTLFGLGREHTAAVVELAMRGAGQIRYLAEIACPRIGVVTNIGTSHLELLGSRENIARAKAELLTALPADGWAIIPAADPFRALLESLSVAPVTTFGFAGEGEPDVAVANLEIAPMESRFTLVGLGERIPVRLPLPGRHNALNAAAAAAAALRAGARPAEVAAGMEASRLPGMRMQVETTAGGVTLLDDVYNASPQSMAAALEHLQRLPGERHVAVLGDMLELGAESRAGHREVGERAAAADLLVTAGERAADIAAAAAEAGLAEERIVRCADAEEALARLRELLRPGDAVLVKASRGMHFERIVRGLQDA